MSIENRFQVIINILSLVNKVIDVILKFAGEISGSSVK